MDVTIKATLEFTISGSDLEDALAEYDELTVEGLIRSVFDKSVAVEDVQTKVIQGPNNLEEYDSIQQSGA